MRRLFKMFTQTNFRALVTVLVIVFSLILIVIGGILITHRPLSADAIAATAAAQIGATTVPTTTPTPAPTIPGVNETVLVCQRQASLALSQRDIVGAVNISDDHLFLFKWVSRERTIEDVNDAFSGIILGFDAALDVWQNECTIFDRVQIDVWDLRQGQQKHCLTVQTTVDHLLRWRAGELEDKELVAELQVTMH